MRILLSILGALALGYTAQAFTNGTLIPSYICGLPTDGFPKSAAGVLPYLLLGVNGNTYNQFPVGTGTTPIAVDTAPSSRDIIGAFHNGLPINYQKATTNAVWIAPYPSNQDTGLPVAGGPTYTITPGKLHTFVIAVNCPINANFTNTPFGGVAGQNLAGYNNPNVALDGFMAYALDTATNQRIGSWVSVGTTLTNFPACNINNQFSPSVGVVHNAVVTDNSNLAGLTWQAPKTIKGTVKFIGVGVADCGYGPIAITYNVSAANGKAGNFTAPSPQAQGLNSQTAANLKAVGPTTPLTLLTPAAALPQPTDVNVATTTDSTSSGSAMTITAGAAAGIGIGCIVAGVAIGGVAMFFAMKKRRGSTGNEKFVALIES